MEVRASATCVDNSFHVAISSLTLLTDILVLAIPFWIVIGLNMPRMVKLAVMLVFLMGIAYVTPFWVAVQISRLTSI